MLIPARKRRKVDKAERLYEVRSAVRWAFKHKGFLEELETRPDTVTPTCCVACYAKVAIGITTHEDRDPAHHDGAGTASQQASVEQETGKQNANTIPYPYRMPICAYYRFSTSSSGTLAI